ncbi:FtsK/SpoIIIE domain-containing protein [Streptomyces sp. NPDC006638]|uniref:FtsK/SpoIIIE domain-containing protein n=1 Tax=Streptomyces sp. NPDC006638 TaxID=3157183 RepID=UPI0033AB76A8
MHLTLTTVDSADGVRRDHLLRLSPHATVGEVAAAVSEPPRPLYSGADRLDPALAAARAGLRDGTLLGIGGPADGPDLVRLPADDTRPALVELHAVSGPGAGRTWRLGQGSHEIGTDVLCAVGPLGDGPDVPADAPGVPTHGLWLTVRADGSAYWHRTDAAPRDTVRGRTVEPPAEDAVTAAVSRAPRPRRGAPAAGGEPAPRPGGPTAWPLGEDLTVGPALLRLTSLVEPDAAVTGSADGFGLDYNRPPRIAPHLDGDRVRMPQPPSPSAKRPFPALMMMLPIALGLVMVWVFHSYYFLVFILFSPLMLVSNWVTGRRSGRKLHEEAERRYAQRRAALEVEIRTAVARERRIRDVTGPDPAAAALTATGPGARLWERRRHDPDHLVLRLGTADQPSLKELEDPAREENHRTVRWNIPDVPVGVDLPAHGVVGVAGGAAAVGSLARWLVIQSAVLHSPRDLRIVLLTEADRAADWDWVRWLPHLRPMSYEASAVPTGPAAVLIGNDEASTTARISELVSQVQSRRRARGDGGRAEVAGPDLLVIADGARRLRDVPGMVQILTDGPAVRIFSVCLDESERLLPEECTGVVLADGPLLTVKRPGMPDLPAVRADEVRPDWCEQVARALAPVRDVSPEHDAGLPQRVRLVDLLGQEPPSAAALLENWREHPASTSFVLGTGFDGPVSLDLVQDGPHGLVAGTTGSGKSELLQTFVISLAAVNRPDELTFVLIDYKGGSAFKECAELPHTLGMVTDLDAHLVERALASLGAELRRRERVLAAADAKDHVEYRTKRAADPALAPLPRLVLVIDEFATLVREVPDFVPGLISLAQRGRSLGIHLILATQRPAGVVTGDIRANTNLRIALRVTDQTESHDVVDTKEAVDISPRTPGRAVVKRGPRSAEPFQTAWVGAERPQPESELAEVRERAPEAAPGGAVAAVPLAWETLGRGAVLPPETDVTVEAPRGPAPTDLQTLVAAIREAAAGLDDFVPQASPWLPALGERVLLDDLEPPSAQGPNRRLLIPYALEDVPELQQRRLAVADLSSFGHLYVIGAPRSGRTQLLRTLAGSAAKTASCADVHLYGIDAGGGGLAALTALPHCGAVVSRHDVERLGRLLRRLNGELTQRQDLAGEHSATGITELRRVLPKAQRPPHILLLIDGWDALSAVLDEHDHGQLVQDVTRLIREGAAAGIHVVATSERALLGGRLAAHNDHKLLLRQGDRSDYQAAGLKLGRVPAVIGPGRGWHVLTGTETQIALLAPGGGTEQVEALRAIGREASRRDNQVPQERRPFGVEPLPGSVEFADAYGKVPESARRPMWGLLGLGGDDAGTVGVDLAGSSSVFAVLGPAGSGRSNALASLAVSLLAGDTSVVVLTPRESPLRALDRHARARVLSEPDPSAETVRAALDALPGPRVVVVDDADLLMTPAADKVLREIALSGRDQGLGLVFAASADGLQSGLSGWTTAARRARRGLLLAPKNMAEGDLAGLRLPTSVVRSAGRPGRAWTAGPDGTPMAVQVPLTVLRPAD